MNIYRTILNHISLFTVYITLLLMCACIGLSFWPVETLDLVNFKVSSYKSRAVSGVGHIVTVDYDYIKHVETPAHFSFALVDGCYYDVYSGVQNMPKGTGHIRKALKVSEEIPKGVYKVQLTIMYELNPFRTESKRFITENSFEVK